MELLLHIDINIFASLIMISLFWITQRRLDKYDMQHKLFGYMCLTVCLMLLLESLKWVINGQSGELFFILNYITNFAIICISPLLGCLWMIYITNFICVLEKKRRKHDLILMLPLIINIFIIIITSNTDLIFMISANNIFSRGRFYPILFSLCYGPLIYTLILLLKNKNKIEKTNFKAFIIFNLLPVFGATIQVIQYGLLSIWSSSAFALLIVFLYAEIKGLQKDHLTGIYNRKQLENFLRIKLRNSRSFSILMIDLDDFKIINDSYGHNEGDKALIAVTNIFLKSTRNIDLVSRYAGDEFIIIMENASSSSVNAMINRIQNNLKDYNMKSGNQYNLQMSIGYYTILDPKNETLESIINAADKSMYAEKSLKKNQVH